MAYNDPGEGKSNFYAGTNRKPQKGDIVRSASTGRTSVITGTESGGARFSTVALDGPGVGTRLGDSSMQTNHAHFFSQVTDAPEPMRAAARAATRSGTGVPSVDVPSAGVPGEAALSAARSSES